jgi:putative acyl-CoA dehydrogenase
MASAFERFERGGNEQEKELFRIGVSVSKYYVTKRLPNFSYECMETFGGNGFVEDFPVARLFRQSPLNSIWEGSGNVMALDILRGLDSLPALMQEINTSNGMDGSLDAFVNNLQKDIQIMAKNPTDIQNQRGARNIVDRLALALQASIMVRYGDPSSAEGYISSRIQSNNGGIGYNYGSHIFKVSSAEEILFRNTPEL